MPTFEAVMDSEMCNFARNGTPPVPCQTLGRAPAASSQSAVGALRSMLRSLYALPLLFCTAAALCRAAGPPTDSVAAPMSKANQAGQWKAALQLFQTAKAGADRSTYADRTSFTEAIVAHGKLGQSDKALDAFREMQAEGLAPNVVSYTATIAACGSQSHWPIALSLFEDMQADGVTPDAYALNAAINACEKGGQWEEAELLLQEMRSLGLTPDRVTYNTAIAAAARAGQWSQTLRLLEAMRQGGEATAPDAWSYSAAMRACERGQQPSAALRLFERMQEEGVPASVVTYNAVLRAADWPVALSLLEDMRDDGLTPDVVTYNTVLSARELAQRAVCPGRRRRPTCPPGAFQGPGRSHAPRAPPKQHGRLAVAPGSRHGPARR